MGDLPAEAVEELRRRILAHPVITTMDSGHQERVRIALEGAGFRVGIASIRSRAIAELRERLLSEGALGAMLEASGWADPTGDDPDMGWGTEGDPYDERPKKRDFRDLLTAALDAAQRGED